MKSLVWVACVSALLGSIAAPAFGDETLTAAALQARIAAATGPAPANYRETITATSGGVTTTIHVFRFGADERTTDDTGPIHQEHGRFHGEAWDQDANGVTVADVPAPSDPARIAATARINVAPDAIVVSELDGNGFGTRRTIDPATYHVTQIERISRAGTRVTHFSDFTVYGAQTLAAKWTITSNGDAAIAVTRDQRVAGDVVADQVAEPPIRRLLAEVPGNARTEIPAMFDGTHIRVPVTIGGHTFHFTLDSGAASIFIDEPTARGLGLTLINPRTISNAQAATDYSAVVPDMTIGTVHMRNIVVNATTLSRDSREYMASRDKVDGLLGFDFFATLGVSIDYSGRHVFVTPATVYQPPSDPQTIPVDIRLGDRVPEVSVGLDGVVANRFVVDTGNGFGSYVVFDYFMDRHPTVGERSSQAITGFGGGGDFVARPFFVHSFCFATYDFRDFNGFRVGQGSYEYAEDGLLGPEFLALFVTDFDYAHGRIYLNPTTNTRRMLNIH